MANTMEYNEIVLYDLAPGVITYNKPPADASGQHFTNSSHHNVSETNREYSPGTKVAVYDNSSEGWSILSYLKYTFQTADSAEAAAAAGHLCARYSIDTSGKWYEVTNESDSGDGNPNSYAAVTLSAMTYDYWGWFWTGGVAPTDWCSGLAATSAIILTNGSVSKSTGVALVDVAGSSRWGLQPTASAVNSVGFAIANDDNQ